MITRRFVGRVAVGLLIIVIAQVPLNKSLLTRHFSSLRYFLNDVQCLNSHMQRSQVILTQKTHTFDTSEVAGTEDEVANSVQAVVVEGGEFSGDAEEDFLKGCPVSAVDEVEESSELL